MKRVIDSLISFLVLGGGYLSGVFIALMSGMIFYEVIVRYLFNAPTTWSVELTSYALPLMAFFGMAYGLEKRRHIQIMVLLDRASEKGKVFLKILSNAIGFLFCMVLLWKGMEWVLETHRIGEVSYTILSIPLYTVRLAFPIGMLLLGIQFLKDLIITCKGWKPGSHTNATQGG